MNGTHWLRLRGGLGRLVAALLRERQVLVRSRGRVRYLHLDGRGQLAFASVALAVLAWVAYASIGYVVQTQRLADRAERVARAERAYAEVIGELGTYQEQLGRAVADLKAGEAALRSASEPGRDGDALKALRRDRKLLMLGREKLRQRLLALQGDLTAIAERQGGLEDEVAAVRTALAAGEADSSRVAQIQDRLDNRIASLEAELADSRQRAADLAERADRLALELGTTEAERARVAAERSRLSHRVQRLMADLDRTRRDKAMVERRADALAADLRESEAARRELAADRERLLAATDRLQRDRRAGRARIAALEDEVGRVSANLERARRARDDLADAGERLAAELQQVRRDLTASTQREDALRARLAGLSGDLAAAGSARRALRQRLAQVNADVAHLEDELAAARDAAAARRAGVGALRAELQAATSDRRALVLSQSRQRSALDRALTGLDSAEAREADLAGHLASLQQVMVGMAERNMQLAADRSDLESRVAGLEARIEDMRQEQANLLERLAKRTRLGIDVIEKTVSMTGIDIEALVDEVREAHSGKGGPFVPLEPDQLTDRPQLQETVAVLDRHIDRWAALQMAIGSLPLAAPLDDYRVSSGYGRRKDPVNGRWAKHDGVDFSAPLRAPVYATAPGTVVHAGWRGHYGRVVEIDHGYGIRTVYAHLREVLVERGERVDPRRRVGLMGSSGRSTGPHVHYEILVDGRPHDPMNFIEAGRHVFEG